MENSRRQFLFASIQIAAWYGVFQLGTSRKAWAKSIRLTAQQWADQIAQLASDVTASRLSGEEWQSAIERLHTRIPLADLIRALDVDRLVRETEQPKERLAVVQDVPIPLTQQTDETFGHKLFVYRRGDSTPPHAHNHLVSAHFFGAFDAAGEHSGADVQPVAGSGTLNSAPADIGPKRRAGVYGLDVRRPRQRALVRGHRGRIRHIRRPRGPHNPKKEVRTPGQGPESDLP
jgi:hypothetical protein